MYTLKAPPPPLEPSVTVERLADNSIKLTWENINTDTGFYDIYTSTSGADSLIIKVPSSTAEYTFRASSGANFDLVNNAERVGVFGTVGGQGTDQRSEPVPPLLPIVTAERLADNSIKVSWENIRTHELFIVFNLFVINGDTEAPVNFIPPGDVRSFTFSPTHDNFNQINDADRVGVSGTIDGKSIDKTFADVPPEPTVTAVRLADDSIKLTWENIRNDARYHVLITESGTDSTLFRLGSIASEFTFHIGSTHFDQVNKAERIGIAGSIGGERVDERFVAVPATTLPTVTAVRLADNSILVTWSNIPTDRDYDLKIIKDGAIDTIQVRIDAESFTILTTHSKFDDVNNADSIGINGIAGTSTTRPIFIPVPDEIACTDRVPVEPCVTAVRLADNSLKVSWENISTDSNYQIRGYDSVNSQTFAINGVVGDSRIILHSDIIFDQVNKAERIGVNGVIDSLAGDQTFAPVPDEIPQLDVTAERLSDDSLKVSWENIRTDNFYNIRITESGTDSSALVRVASDTSEFTFTPSHDLFERVSNAQRVGVNGAINGERVDQVFEAVPASILPTVTAERLSNGNLKLSWANIRTDTSTFSIFITESGRNNNIFPVSSSNSEHIFVSSRYLDRVNGAEKVGVAGPVSRSTEHHDLTLVPVPVHGRSTTPPAYVTPEPIPLLTAERLEDSYRLMWDDIPTDGGDWYYFIIPEDDDYSEVDLRVGTDVEEYTLESSHLEFVRIINAGEICIIGSDDTDSRSPNNDERECTDIGVKKNGNTDEWKTKPTFGNSWNSQTQLVDAGFVFNGIALTITDNWHTDFNLTSSIIGENNTIHIKGYAPNDFKSVTLSLGIPEIGKKYDAESHITLNLNRNYTAPSDYQITEILHDQKEGLVNESMTGATLSKAKCTPADVVKRCLDFEISFTIMAPLKHEVLAISAMDTRHRETVTFINQGVEFVGESLLVSQTHTLTQKYSNQHPVQTIELTQLDRRYQMWEDQNGYLWTQNEYDSWLQITMPDIPERDDPATSVMTRNHSNFAGMVTLEQDRAVLIFNSLDIQGISDEPFAHDIPIKLEKLSDPEVLEILHIQALLAEELLCDCILLED